ncbi:MAG: hypothetical protein WA510_24015 [Acidobacteriaceae bacterium]
MQQIDKRRRSCSFAVYGMLLSLYPQEYLRHHRAEMLQNFEDFERVSSSKAELWLFMGKDLVNSFRSHLIKSLSGQTAIILLVLTIALALAQRHPGEREHAVWIFCYGYLPGWFVGWWGMARQAKPNHIIPHYPKTLWGQGVIIGIVLAITISVAREPSIWVICYGLTLGWFAGRFGKWRQISH